MTLRFIPLHVNEYTVMYIQIFERFGQVHSIYIYLPMMSNPCWGPRHNVCFRLGVFI